ncbi:MAG: hypothetical protein JSS90_08460 [Bacteroidetes bacterium]|jgi:hypothetical protein|nr:hypothetical protein [Bacteroidota bacterium]
MYKVFKSYLLLAGIFLCFASCESNHFLKSEKKLKSDIIGTWNRVLFGNELEESWTFVDGNLKISQPSRHGDTLDVGEYTIDATLSTPYLKIQNTVYTNQNPGGDTYNYKWSIIRLDNKVLEIATESELGGLAQIEFVKQ